MVNRVFCYSEEEALKNRNKLSILQLLLVVIVSIIVFTVIAIFSNSEILFIAAFLIFMVILICFSIMLSSKMQSKLTGYATDINGRVFKVVSVNNGQELYVGGMGVGSLVDHITGNSSRLGESLGGAIGAVAFLCARRRAEQCMRIPELIAKIVESAPNVTGVEVYEILNVYSINDVGKSFKIKCDYKILRKNKIKYNKTITIEKSFIMWNDLINILNTHRSM